MAPELSSNWKKLQAQIKAESQSNAKPKVEVKASSTKTEKRKAGLHGEGDSSGRPTPKRQKVRSNGSKPSHPKPLKKDSKPDQEKHSQGIPMGSAQSKPEDVPTTGVSPSLALWAEDNGISSEALAEAYGLGIKDKSMLDAASVKPNEGLAPGIEVGKYIAIDCEMVGVGDDGHESALARVSMVDFHGKQVYDSYVRPKERVTDWRTHVSGVGPKHMATARSFEQVQTQAAELLKGRILVGHDVRHDLQALLLEHPSKMIRDTARFSGFRKYGHGPKPALRVLAKEILDVEIQTGQHSSIEDARVAMLLFRRYKPGFDVEHAKRFGETNGSNHKAKSQQKMTKKKRRN